MKGNFDALGQVVQDVAKALGDVDIQEIDQALATVPRFRNLADEIIGSGNCRRKRHFSGHS